MSIIRKLCINKTDILEEQNNKAEGRRHLAGTEGRRRDRLLQEENRGVTILDVYRPTQQPRAVYGYRALEMQLVPTEMCC